LETANIAHVHIFDVAGFCGSCLNDLPSWDEDEVFED
jgi:hypothetical protein